MLIGKVLIPCVQTIKRDKDLWKYHKKKKFREKMKFPPDNTFRPAP